MNLKKMRLSATMVLVVFSVLLLTSTAAVFADVKLPAVIGDNMVLQRGKKVSICKNRRRARQQQNTKNY